MTMDRQQIRWTISALWMGALAVLEAVAFIDGAVHGQSGWMPWPLFGLFAVWFGVLAVYAWRKRHET